MGASTLVRLLAAAQALPEALQHEVLDFAEFLQRRRIPELDHRVDLSLRSLCGGLENSPAFAGDPLVIQRQLRDEWS